MNLPFERQTAEGQTALVTGASRGLGRAIARRLAKEGAAVCINYVNSAEAAESLAGEIRATGGREALRNCEIDLINARPRNARKARRHADVINGERERAGGGRGSRKRLPGRNEGVGSRS
jgi:NAD(P)-dependent dehydrogenase (short-subunit alcohol dehydrogenase family)